MAWWGSNVRQKELAREKRFRKWETVRARGKGRFILKTGGFWGLWMYAVLSLIPVLLHKRPLHELWVGAIAWSLGGYLFGTLMWSFSERSYLKDLEQKGLRPVAGTHFP